MSVVFGEPTPFFLELEPLNDGVPRVRITIYNVPPGTTIQIRRTSGGETMVVQGIFSQVTSDAGVFVDWAAPLNVEATYTVLVDGQAQYSGSVTLTSDTAWIQDPLQPDQALPVHPSSAAIPGNLVLDAEALASVAYAAPGETVRIMGSRYPRFFGGGRQGGTGVALPLLAMTPEMHDAFLGVIAEAPVLLFRPLPSMRPLPPVCYLRADVTDAPPNTVAGREIARFTVEGDLVKAVLQAAVSGFITYAQVDELLAGYTYGDVQAAAASTMYLDWQKNPLIFTSL